MQNVGRLYVRAFISSRRIWAIQCSLHLHGVRSPIFPLVYLRFFCRL